MFKALRYKPAGSGFDSRWCQEFSPRNGPGWDPKSGFGEDCDNTYGPRWSSWLSHCTTSRKLVGSIPYDVIGIFHRHILSGSTTSLRSSQPLSEMSTRNISWGVKTVGV